MSSRKWRDKESDSSLDYVVVLLVSRNKDNSNLEGFKERRESFLHTLSHDYLERRFSDFVKRGVPGEFCRLYVSANARDTKKVHRALLHEMVDMDELPFNHVESFVASVAARHENALEKRWLLDVDSNDGNDLFKVVSYVPEDTEYVTYYTPHGYAVVVSHGFDTRELLKDCGDFVTVKKDDLLCLAWRVTN